MTGQQLRSAFGEILATDVSSHVRELMLEQRPYSYEGRFLEKCSICDAMQACVQ